MVLVVNGIPVFAFELKNQYTGQNVDNAKTQWMYDRDSRDICFQFNKRILAYFCVDHTEVWMTTKLAGKDTCFLPFNQGSNGAGADGGAGNPPNPDGYPTAYLWENVFQKDSMLDIILKFINLQKKKTVIFPRYHQLDVVRKLVADVRTNGAGKNYLIQHSAGSGKSNSTAWTAYRLASLFDGNNKPIFSSVIVVTDRTVLDAQLQETIAGFDHKLGAIETIGEDKNSQDLKNAINNSVRIIVTTLQKFPVIYTEVDKKNGRCFVIIVDEAHSSQTGSSVLKLKTALAGTEEALREYAEREGLAEEEVDPEDRLVKEMIAQGKHRNLSFFAFTATPNGKTRPISIYCYEDKLVQEALRRLLEAVFEPHFYEEMMGFRPNRGCHMALRKLNGMIENQPTNYVLDADIKGFFDHIDHEWAVKFIESRIKDPNVTRLVRRMLKAGIMKDFQYEETEEGSGQGSVCSPIIANIYMHYVLLWWFKEKVKPYLGGYAGIIVYADDFVCCFEYKEDAEQFYERLKQRMGHFALELEESKSRLIEFGRYAQEWCRKNRRKPETFTFLGFTHYCSKSRNGKFRVKRKTSKKKFAKKCREVHREIAKMRTMQLAQMIKKLNEILVGYYHYYGITDNYKGIDDFCLQVRRSLFHWLNRRSQKKSYTWEAFNTMLKAYPLARPKIYVSIYG